jgi:hypothetical protein
MPKRIILKATNVVAGIAGMIFWLIPLRTGTQVLLCIGCIAVLIICSVLLSNLDDKNTGYWPDNPNR